MAVCKRPNSGGPTNTVDSSNRISSSSEPQESLESVKKISLDLAKDVIPYLSNINASCAPLNEHAKTLRRTSDEICRQHEILFNIVRLNVINNNVHDTGSSLKRVMDEMFTDGHFNWGRVVTVLCFRRIISKVLQWKWKTGFCWFHLLHNGILCLGKVVYMDPSARRMGLYYFTLILFASM